MSHSPPRCRVQNCPQGNTVGECLEENCLETKKNLSKNYFRLPAICMVGQAITLIFIKQFFGHIGFNCLTDVVVVIVDDVVLVALQTLFP